MKNTIEELPEASGVFVEAAIIDTFNNLVFASFWGHTAAIQNTIALITTGELKTITINGTSVSVCKEMLKKVGKLPADNAYGDMTHALIYRATTQQAQAGKREIIFYGKPPEKLIFTVIQSMSTLPLLDGWLMHLLSTFREREMLIDLKTLCGDVHGIHINLGSEDELSELISSKIKSHQLDISGGE